MTVTLMMSSWLAVNYFELQRNSRYKETQRTIESIKEAVINYAANHAARSYVVVNDSVAQPIRWRQPAGRPYLPCPDINGDGEEDRSPVLTALEITLNPPSYPQETGGDCFRNKGLVPWVTLDMPPTDSWGNRYTYRAGNNFSNAMVGFDQETRADQAYYTLSLIHI